jgi:hypothetical protein
MRVAKNYSFLFFILFLLIVSYFYFSSVHASYQHINSFTSCIDAGFKASLTYPETCNIPGKTFINEEQQAEIKAKVTHIPSTTLEQDYKNLIYFLNGTPIQFSHGSAFIHVDRAPTSTLTIMDTPLLLLDVDNQQHIAFLIVHKDSKSKDDTYYLSSATTLNTGSVGLNMIRLDTAIASTTYTYASGTLTVLYSTVDAHTKIKHFMFENTLLKEITK